MYRILFICKPFYSRHCLCLKVFLFLCVVGATVAAPQGLSRSVVSSGADENQVSNNDVIIIYSFPFFATHFLAFPIMFEVSN